MLDGTVVARTGQEVQTQAPEFTEEEFERNYIESAQRIQNMPIPIAQKKELIAKLDSFVQSYYAEQDFINQSQYQSQQPPPVQTQAPTQSQQPPVQDPSMRSLFFPSTNDALEKGETPEFFGDYGADVASLPGRLLNTVGKTIMGGGNLGENLYKSNRDKGFVNDVFRDPAIFSPHLRVFKGAKIVGKGLAYLGNLAVNAGVQAGGGELLGNELNQQTAANNAVGSVIGGLAGSAIGSVAKGAGHVSKKVYQGVKDKYQSPDNIPENVTNLIEPLKKKLVLGEKIIPETGGGNARSQPTRADNTIIGNAVQFTRATKNVKKQESADGFKKAAFENANPINSSVDLDREIQKYIKNKSFTHTEETIKRLNKSISDLSIDVRKKGRDTYKDISIDEKNIVPEAADNVGGETGEFIKHTDIKQTKTDKGDVTKSEVYIDGQQVKDITKTTQPTTNSKNDAFIISAEQIEDHIVKLNREASKLKDDNPTKEGFLETSKALGEYLINNAGVDKATYKNYKSLRHDMINQLDNTVKYLNSVGKRSDIGVQDVRNAQEFGLFKNVPDDRKIMVNKSRDKVYNATLRGLYSDNEKWNEAISLIDGRLPAEKIKEITNYRNLLKEISKAGDEASPQIHFNDDGGFTYAGGRLLESLIDYKNIKGVKGLKLPAPFALHFATGVPYSVAYAVNTVGNKVLENTKKKKLTQAQINAKIKSLIEPEKGFFKVVEEYVNKISTLKKTVKSAKYVGRAVGRETGRHLGVEE